MQDNKRKKRNTNFKRIKAKEEIKRKEEIRKEQWVGWRCVAGWEKLRMLLVKPIFVKVKPSTLNPKTLKMIHAKCE